MSTARPPASRLLRPIRRKCFISYHHADHSEVVKFIDRFGSANFIHRAITMPEDVINSNNTDYVMSRIRQLYIRDSTVTIVLIGKCTWARKFVDWEVQASLRTPANGLLAILLDSSKRPRLPTRVKTNVDSGYARYRYYPDSARTLGTWIEDAYAARTSRETARLNPRERKTNNSQCPRLVARRKTYGLQSNP
jgi:hypothetical protein